MPVIEIYEHDTADREIALTDSNGDPYDLTGMDASLDIGLTPESERLVGKATGGSNLSHDDAGGILTVSFVAADWDSIPHIDGRKVNGVAATDYHATLRLDGDAVDAQITVRVFASVPTS